MKLLLKKNLTPFRAAALAALDGQTFDIRAKHRTLAAGQDAVYAEKRREAELIVAGGSPGEAPHVAAEAEVNGITPFDQAVEILTAAHNWATVSAAIEVARLRAKAAIAAAKTSDEIASVRADWPQSF